MSDIVAIGMMSGTSFDGVDVALIETDGETVSRRGATGYRPYTDAERQVLRDALASATTMTDRRQRPGIVGEAERVVTQAHVEALAGFLQQNAISPGTIDVVGFHGQTVLHRPQDGLTVQIGDGEALARASGIPVVFDFRVADMAAGGQGAPLVPVYHRALAATVTHARPLVVVNIGGVSNITYLDGAEDPIACDTGPGNALLDDFMQARIGEAFDRDGAAAARGRIDEDFIARVLDDPFFAAACPKSLDRNAFAQYGLPAGETDDGAATLTALTAAAIARIVLHLPKTPRTWIIAGGGARNATLMRMLRERLGPATVETADAVGWSADALEAQAFAYLAVRRLRGKPVTFPTTTGVRRPAMGGVVAMPDAPAAASA